MFHAIFPEPFERFLIPMAFWNGVISGFHFRAQKKESSDEM
jgi:hypothetical protein